MTDEPYEPITREALEEQAARARDLGRVTRSYFDGFTEAGFTDTQALLLTRTWLSTSMGDAE